MLLERSGSRDIWGGRRLEASKERAVYGDKKHTSLGAMDTIPRLYRPAPMCVVVVVRVVSVLFVLGNDTTKLKNTVVLQTRFWSLCR